PTFAAPVQVFSGNAATNQQCPTEQPNWPDGGEGQDVSLGTDGTKLAAVWTAWLFDEPDQENVYIGSTSVMGSGTWTAAATLFQPTLGDPQHKTGQVYAYQAGSIGVIGVSFRSTFGAGQNEAQFFLLASPPTITCTPTQGRVKTPYDFTF